MGTRYTPMPRQELTMDDLDIDPDLLTRADTDDLAWLAADVTDGYGDPQLAAA